LKAPLDENRLAQRGAALLIVLWTALLLSALMAGALASARIEAKIAASRAEKFKARQALESALDLAAWKVAVGEYDEDSGAIVDDLTLNGYSVKAEFSLEQEKIDLNLASEEIWRDFLRAAGAAPGLAETLAAQIADWRDADDDARPNGAEARDYLQAEDKAIGNRPFSGVGELNLVLGMTPELYACIAPAVSIFATGAAPSPRAMALIDAEASSARPEPRRARLGTSARGATPGRRIVVEATATRGNGLLSPQRLAAVFRMVGEPSAPYARILEFEPEEETPAECVQSPSSDK
jgi:general secretion pathway protein K